jgi:GNAT superfamily N-acetyltransferase
MPIAIRDACPEDATALAELVTALGYLTEAARLEERLGRMPRDFYRTLVAAEGARVVGFVGVVTLPVYEHDAPIGWILALSVAEDFRRRGVGRRLLQAAEEHGRARGVVDLRLHSGFQRDGAHEFYEKMGFDKSGYRFKKRLT